MMGKFHSTFRVNRQEEDNSPASWVNHFKPSNPSAWEAEKSGAIQYITDDGERYSLIMNYDKGKGVTISYDRFKRGDIGQNFSMIACGDSHIGVGFEQLDNGMMVPVGSFLSLEAAWPIIKEFIEEPTTTPTSASWIDSKSLNWPEDY